MKTLSFFKGVTLVLVLLNPEQESNMDMFLKKAINILLLDKKSPLKHKK